MKSPKIISILNQKGGSGKTSLTVNLAAALAIKHNKKICVIDLDLQSNASSNLIGYKEIREPSLADLFLKEERLSERYLYQSKIKNLKIIPSDERMMKVDIQLVARMAREKILKEALNSKASEEFDFIFCDNPPYISLISLNSLTASDYVLVPITPSFFSLFGLKLLQKTIHEVKQHLNPKLDVLGFILNCYDRRKSVTDMVYNSLKASFPKELFDCNIRVNTHFDLAPSKEETIFEFENQKNKKGIEDYTQCAMEFLNRILEKEKG